MNRCKLFMAALALLLVSYRYAPPIAAQQSADDVPYLSDDDIASVEITLPDDVPAAAVETTPKVEPENAPELENAPEIMTEPAVPETRLTEASIPEPQITQVPVPASAPLVSENELSRLNVGLQPLYHLLIIDRTRCAQDADISGISGDSLVYKLRHGKNGYLIALYQSPATGPVFPVLPDNSRIILDLMTNRKNTIKEYLSSTAFRKFVTSAQILAQIQEALEREEE